MARAGASKSLDQRAPKARGASDAVKPAPAKPAAKPARKKTEPAVVAPKPAAKAAKTAKATPGAKPAAAAKKAVKAVKAAKSAVGAGKAVKAGPAKAVNVRTKAAPAAKRPSTRKNSEVPQVAQAPKAKRAGTATKAPAKAAAVAIPDKSDGGFPAKTLDRLRRLLEEERETYVRQARDLAAEAESLAAEREPGDTQFDEESGEGDTLNVERERDLALSASATQAVEDIDRALGRMALGTFGICERCGKKIAVARLEALPFASLCIECKSREERRR
ncbi:MAG TPA: TraR/DksA C4-type zinc finger protein [Acidimicrobiia bacterium]|nr:TraR/DksA C4-type zinc finger protein [Acidimicrobiia bacterium]